jgi:hypothetical protein
MTSEIFCLAEAASLRSGGFSLLHTFSNWGTVSFPTTVLGMVCAQVRFSADKGEAGQHALRADLVSPDGEVVWSSDESPCTAVFPTDNSQTSAVHAVWPMAVQLFVAGNHELRLVVSSQETNSRQVLAATPLGIVQVS